jgi:hypothetical protein
MATGKWLSISLAAAGAAAVIALIVAADRGQPMADGMSTAVAGPSRTAVEVSPPLTPSFDMTEQFYKEKLAAPIEDLPAQF